MRHVKHYSGPNGRCPFQLHQELLCAVRLNVLFGSFRSVV